MQTDGVCQKTGRSEQSKWLRKLQAVLPANQQNTVLKLRLILKWKDVDDPGRACFWRLSRNLEGHDLYQLLVTCACCFTAAV